MVRTKIICEKCGREISKSNYSKHLRGHENHPEYYDNSKYHLDHDDLFCKFCNKEFKNRNALVQHEIRCKENLDKINTKVPGFNAKGNVPWNKGLTKETDERVVRSAIMQSKSKKGRPNHPQTLETRLKISKARIKYLRDNPNKVPYLLNHSSKESYPEIYFKKLFANEGLDLVYHRQLSVYQLDFSNEQKKLCVEVDGEQHYLDPSIVKSDLRRDKYLADLGWTVFRIRWSLYKKMSDSGKAEIINKIKKLLN